MDPPTLNYQFISRFLDNDKPTVNANFKEFLLKDGVLQMLMAFITQNFPPHIKKETGVNAETSGSSTETEAAAQPQHAVENVPLETLRSYKVMDLFVHPTPPFILLVKDKLSIIYLNVTDTTLEPRGNIHHFCKVLQCLFGQFTFEVVNALAEVYVPAQRTYLQILIENLRYHPVREFLLFVSKRAARSVSEYQTTNPIDTKKIQKGLTKSKFYQQVSNFFSRPTKGCSDFIIRCIEDLNIYGPDIGLQFCYFQTKEFADTLGKVLSSEGAKKYTFGHRQLCMGIITALLAKSTDHSNSNAFQDEKDSIFSSGTTSWVQYFSSNHINSLARLLMDMGHDPYFKKHLSSFRIDTMALLLNMVKSKNAKKKSSNQPFFGPELWSFLVDWFFQYNLVIEVFSQNHLPSVKNFCVHHLKRFIAYYLDAQASDTQPSSQFLPTFLKNNEVWIKFLPVLIADTQRQYQPSGVIDDINLGSEFAESLGIEDSEKKKQSKGNGANNTGGAGKPMVLVDELNSEQISKLEEELCIDDESSKSKKKGKGKKKK
eukprot:gene17953-21418_t